MSPPPVFSNVETRADLTRWNRAHLARFDYVDANAATLLEELKLALLGLTMRGADARDRSADAWRALAMRPVADRPGDAEINALLARVDWTALHPDLPARALTRAQYNASLQRQYEADPGNPAWEIMRAFARAAHVLLGHLDAYANEGYLRTATQWDNLRRLAAMVNYQPAPPASAKTSIALLLDEALDGHEISAGLAVKFSPPAGGPPLIYETLDTLDAHPALNGARLAGWSKNRTVMQLARPQNWTGSTDPLPPPGSLGVIARIHGGSELIRPVQLTSASRPAEATTARIAISPAPSGQWHRFKTSLHLEADGMLNGLPRTDASGLVLAMPSADQFSVNSIVRIAHGNGRFRAVVLSAANGYLKLATTHRPTGDVTVEAFVPYEVKAGKATTPTSVGKVFFRRVSGTGGSTIGIGSPATASHNSAHVFTRPAQAAGKAYAPSADSPLQPARVVDNPPEVIPGQGVRKRRTVAFAGTPPKALQAGSYFALRDAQGSLAARRVIGVHEAEDQYFVLFDAAVDSTAETTQFHGPMTRDFRPLDHDRSTQPAVSGHAATLAPLPAGAAERIKPGRAAILEHDRAINGTRFAQAVIADRTVLANGKVRLSLETDADLSGWTRGGTQVRLNVVDIGHGETRTAKTLGSGDGEKEQQSFRFKIKDVSFTPSTRSLNGVEPALDIRVDAERWTYADYTDPAADGTRSWSYTFTEDGMLDIHFRRRLSTGSGNLVIDGYRVGTGAAGNALPALAIDKPMKKHVYVTGIVQPFAATGGADRESVDAVRENAPAQIIANGRAVALADFQHLCRRHSSIAQARAERIFLPGSTDRVRITIIPQGGGLSDAALKSDLVDYLKPRALPGISIEIVDHEPLNLSLSATLKVDLERFGEAYVRNLAIEAMTAAFSLDARQLGQPVYIAEIMSVLSGVRGVDAALVTDFALKPGSPILRTGEADGEISAFFPDDNQILLLDAARDLSLKLEAPE